jgi:excisionase family DNA binding protein
MKSSDRPPLTIPEAARELNTSENVIRYALKGGELSGFKIGKAWRILPEIVDQKRAGEAAKA